MVVSLKIKTSALVSFHIVCGPLCSSSSKLIFLRISFVSKPYTYQKYRHSLLKVFCKKSVLKNLAKLIGKYLAMILFFNKIAGWCLQLY